MMELITLVIGLQWNIFWPLTIEPIMFDFVNLLIVDIAQLLLFNYYQLLSFNMMLINAIAW